jgi:lysophospholipase L1-like esterase
VAGVGEDRGASDHLLRHAGRADAAVDRLVLPTTQRQRRDLALAVLAVAVGAAVAYLLRRDYSTVATGMLFIVAVGTAAAVVTRLGLRLAGLRRLLAPVTLAVATTTVMLGALELVLRYGVGTRATYAETNGHPNYRSIYRYDNPTWYHLYGRNRTIRDVKPEFTHVRTTNALGLPERDVAKVKAADEYRVLALGDSYTEGVGASYDETWVRVFEREVSPLPDGRTVRAINAGISSSDLLLQYVLLRDRLKDYGPNLVIAALNNSDVADLLARGGMERFRPDGRIRGDRGPAWDWLYGISYITRHIVHDVLGHSWLLLTPDAERAAQATAREHLHAGIRALAELSRDIGATFVLVLIPHEYEVKDGQYEQGFGPLVDALTASHPPDVIDLLALYKRAGTLTPGNSSEHYWRLDYHHNARGYALMGRTMAAEFRARGLLPGTP